MSSFINRARTFGSSLTRLPSDELWSCNWRVYHLACTPKLREGWMTFQAIILILTERKSEKGCAREMMYVVLYERKTMCHLFMAFQNWMEHSYTQIPRSWSKKRKMVVVSTLIAPKTVKWVCGRATLRNPTKALPWSCNKWKSIRNLHMLNWMDIDKIKSYRFFYSIFR